METACRIIGSRFPLFSSLLCLQVSKVGVFSCGPRAVTRANTIACETVNTRRKLPHFINHFENFG